MQRAAAHTVTLGVPSGLHRHPTQAPHTRMYAGPTTQKQTEKTSTPSAPKRATGNSGLSHAPPGTHQWRPLVEGVLLWRFFVCGLLFCLGRRQRARCWLLTDTWAKDRAGRDHLPTTAPSSISIPSRLDKVAKGLPAPGLETVGVGSLP